MAELQWLAMPVVSALAVIATIYFGRQNQRNVVTQREHDSGYASGRIEVKLENVEQMLRGVNQRLDAHDVLLRQLRGEAKKQSKRLRKLDKRVRTLESNPTGPPTGPLAKAWDRDAMSGLGGKAT